MLRVEVIGANEANAEEIKNVVVSAIGSTAEIITATKEQYNKSDKADLYVCLINRKAEIEAAFGSDRVVALELVPPTEYFLQISRIPAGSTVLIFNNSTAGTKVLLQCLKKYNLQHVKYQVIPYDELSSEEIAEQLSKAEYITGGIAYVGNGSTLYAQFGRFLPKNIVVLVSPPRVATSESICRLSNVFSGLYHKVVMEELKRLSCEDYLTQIPNRRTFDEFLQQEWLYACQENTFLSLAMIDIDFFKNYNDHYGHLAGDECLKKISQVLKHIMGSYFCARYGGEEYSAVLPHTEAQPAQYVLERFREEVIKMRIVHQYSDVLPVVTVSIGIASAKPAEETIKLKEFLERADKALYQAKRQGRNRIIVL